MNKCINCNQDFEEPDYCSHYTLWKVCCLCFNLIIETHFTSELLNKIIPDNATQDEVNSILDKEMTNYYKKYLVKQ